MATNQPRAATTAPHMFLSHVALAELKSGDELKGASVNARKGTDPAAVKSLAKSISEVGLLVPLTVTRPGRDKGPWYVLDGNTRLAAIQSLHKAADWPAVLVPTFEPSDGADAVQGLELSMIANSERSDLHPVDRFEVFERMVKNGATVEQIGARYMLKPAQVRQALALARMAPVVRQAWRDGKIDDEAAEAYAQTPDLEHQVRIMKKLKGRVDAWAVNREITGDDNVGTLLKFVGRAEYEKAGHHVNDSLFSDDERHATTVANVPALKAMASKKIEDECARLIADGWGWAVPKDAAPKDAHAWRRTNPTPSKEFKAQAGCTVDMDYNGSLKVERGYIKPGVSVVIPKSPADKKKQADAAQRKKESGGLSQLLCFRLSTAITKAAAETIAADPPLALRAAVAGMACAGAPVTIDIRGEDHDQIETRHDNEFGKYFAALDRKAPFDLLKALAPWVGAALQMVGHAPDSMPMCDDEGGSRHLLEAMKPAALNAALRKHFDRADYFASVNADQVKAAITDCAMSYPANAKKGDLAKLAVASVAKNWLPPEMRTKHYDGPAAKTAKPAAPRKKKRR